MTTSRNGTRPQPDPVPPNVEPRFVTLAYQLYLAAAALSVVSLVVAITTTSSYRASIASELAREKQHISSGQLDAIITATTVINVIFAIIWVFAFVFFARKMRRGANWARITLTVVTFLSFINFGSGYWAGAAQFAAALAAVILMWLPRSNRYFKAIKAERPNARSV
jgi:hypothetical protein